MESFNGLDFRAVENDIILSVEGEWSGVAVRSPTVLVDNGKLRMWFAGDNYDFLDIVFSSFKAGMGLVELDLEPR
jgi:hypothetical protein